MFEWLKAAAAAPRLVSHSEVMHAAGLPAVRCGIPSGGLFRNAGFELDLKKPSHRVWWRAMALHVFATDWSGVEL